jgi:hypothetical protein
MKESEQEIAEGAEMSDAEAEQTAWEWFASAHPHEAHASWPDRFWILFHSRFPDLTREHMGHLLRTTEKAHNG